MSNLELTPRGLVDPLLCRATKWTAVRASMRNGRVKWNEKNLVSVAPSTEYPPQIHDAMLSPINGKAVNMEVMTVAAQKLI